MMSIFDKIINSGFTDPATLQGAICLVPIGISYGSDIDKTRGILLELAGKHPKARHVCGCPLTQLANAGVVLTLDVWCDDALAATAFRCDFLEQAVKRFALEGIGMAVPKTEVALIDDRHLKFKQEKGITGLSGPNAETPRL